MGQADIDKGEMNMATYTYVVCPLCGRNRVTHLTEAAEKKGKSPTVRWDFVNLKKFDLIQIREQHPREVGKKSKGFPIVDTISFSNAIDDPAYSDAVDGLKKQLLRLVKDALDIGFIEKKDILSKGKGVIEIADDI